MIHRLLTMFEQFYQYAMYNFSLIMISKNSNGIGLLDFPKGIFTGLCG